MGHINMSAFHLHHSSEKYLNASPLLPVQLRSPMKIPKNSQRISSIPMLAFKSSCKNLRFKQGNSSQAYQNPCSYRRKRKNDTEKAYKSTSSIVNCNNRIVTNEKLDCITQSTSSDIYLIDKKLSELEEIECKAVAEYLKVLNEIILHDDRFGSILVRISKGLQKSFESLKEKEKYSKVSEEKETEKHNFLESLIEPIENNDRVKNKIVKDRFMTVRVKSPKCKSDIQVSKYDPREEIIEKSTQSLTKSEKQIKHLEATVKQLQKELLELKEKEKKFNLLIKAMNDRGYPVDQIYTIDVLKLIKQLKGENIEGILYPNQELSLLSSDVSQDSIIE